MTSTSITFRYSLSDRIFLGFGIIFFASLALFSWMSQTEQHKDRIAIAFLGFAGLSLFAFLGALYKVTVTEKEIMVWNMFRVHRLAWIDIYEVIGSEQDSFTLSDRNGDVSVYISSQVKGYFRLVEIIKQMRPDIWKAQEDQTFQNTRSFHQNPLAAIYYGVLSVGVLVFSFFIPSSGNQTIDLLGRTMMWFMGIAGLITVAQMPRKLEFYSRHLIISSYGGWKKTIHVSEVVKVSVHRENMRGTVVNYVEMDLGNKKKVALSGYKEGMPLLLGALEKWIVTNKIDHVN